MSFPDKDDIEQVPGGITNSESWLNSVVGREHEGWGGNIGDGGSCCIEQAVGA